MTEQTGCYDRHGIPIHAGDLIRVKHYRHYRCRRQMWVYFRVAIINRRFVVQAWNDLDATHWQCLLCDIHADNIEVLAESPHGSSQGLVTFNERKRLKKEAAK